MVVRNVLVSAGGVHLSALTACPEKQPARGIILALHGGGSSARYWNNPVGWGNSLLELGSALGFHVLAVDRPGYGESSQIDPSLTSLKQQVPILFAGLDSWCAKLKFDGPRFIIGHSVGAILTTMMAADPGSRTLSGCAGVGVALRYSDNAAANEINSWAAQESYAPRIDAATHRLLCFGLAGSFTEAAREYDHTCYGPMPILEYREAMGMVNEWPTLMPTIRIPIQLTCADAETMMVSDEKIVEDMKALLRDSVHSRVELQRGAGHDVSAHLVGLAYHLRAVAFFEECSALRRAGIISS